MLKDALGRQNPSTEITIPRLGQLPPCGIPPTDIHLADRSTIYESALLLKERRNTIQTNRVPNAHPLIIENAFQHRCMAAQARRSS